MIILINLIILKFLNHLLKLEFKQSKTLAKQIFKNYLHEVLQFLYNLLAFIIFHNYKKYLLLICNILNRSYKTLKFFFISIYYITLKLTKNL